MQVNKWSVHQLVQRVIRRIRFEYAMRSEALAAQLRAAVTEAGKLKADLLDTGSVS